MNRLSDLLGTPVVDADGFHLGRVRDVRLVQDGPKVGMVSAGLRVQGLVVGPSGLSDRLGYDRRGVRGPWLVSVIVRHLRRHDRYVPWGQVTVAGDQVHLACRAAELESPQPLPEVTA